jgi:hypothetical protein
VTVAVGTMLPDVGRRGLAERRAVVAGLEAAGVDEIVLQPVVDPDQEMTVLARLVT